MLIASTDTIKTKHKDSVIKYASSVMTNFTKKTLKDTLAITVSKDSIWRHLIHNGRQRGDYQLVTINDSILYNYGRDKKLKYGKFNLFKKSDEYKIEENLKDRKVIKGLNCHKMIITRVEPKSDLGNTIYELYVTKQLNLPLHTVLNIGIFMSNTFPAEIMIKQEKMEGFTENYHLVELF